MNEEYFARVAGMVEQAARYGLTCALVLIWCNRAPDTWISEQSLEYVILFDAVGPYITYVVKLLDRYNPKILFSIFSIGGQT